MWWCWWCWVHVIHSGQNHGNECVVVDVCVCVCVCVSWWWWWWWWCAFQLGCSFVLMCVWICHDEQPSSCWKCMAIGRNTDFMIVCVCAGVPSLVLRTCSYTLWVLTQCLGLFSYVHCVFIEIAFKKPTWVRCLCYLWIGVVVCDHLCCVVCWEQRRLVWRKTKKTASGEKQTIENASGESFRGKNGSMIVPQSFVFQQWWLRSTIQTRLQYNT